MKPLSADHPTYQRVATSLARQGMMTGLGVRLVAVGEGWVELAMPYADRVAQQQGTFHGGAIGALGDIAGGYAALTVAPEGMEVVSVEYKVNFLASFQAGELHGLGRVVKPGKRLIVASAEIVHVAPDGQRNTCAVLQQTLMPVPKAY